MMLIEVSLTISPINYLKISKYLESVNWRISHVTKRPVKQHLTLPEKKIHILAGNLRSTEFPLFIQYCDHLLLEFPCLLLTDTIQVSIKLSDHLQSALNTWVSEAIFTTTLVEAPLWPEISKSLQNVTWPTCSVVFDTVDINCQVGGVTRRSMSNEAGFFTINALAQSVDWAVPQDFSPPPPPPFSTPPPPYQPGPRHAGTNSGSHGRARGRGRARHLPRGQPHAQGLGPRYRHDQLQEIARQLFDQSSHEYDSLTSGHQTPPRQSSPLHSSPPRRPTPPPPPQRGSSPVASGGQVQASLRGALGAIQAIYGPSLGLSEILQGLQDLAVRPQSPVAPATIHTVELDPVEDAQQLNDEGLWNRDASGRLHCVPRGQTSGSAESGTL